MAKIAIIGGSGPEGQGLGLRFAMAGHQVALGSRSTDRATKAAMELLVMRPELSVIGLPNAEAVEMADMVVLSVPYDGLGSTLDNLYSVVSQKLVVSVVAPLTFEGGSPTALPVLEGSAAQKVAKLLPESQVVAAFHHVSAQDLLVPDRLLEGDVIVCADDQSAKDEVMALANELVSLRAVDGGGLGNARYVEELTAFLLHMNKRYRTRATIQFLGLAI